jgi:hypothetical protein
MEYGEKAADIFGQLNELVSVASPSPPGPGEKNMDLWNNAVGRKHGNDAKSREELAAKLRTALLNGELILTPDDNRQFSLVKPYLLNVDFPVIVLAEDKRGRNEWFFDLMTKSVMDRATFVASIRLGNYQSYRVAVLNGVETPVSRGDGNEGNNLA